MIRPELRELSLSRRMALRVRLTAALELRDEGLPERDETGHEIQSALKERLFAATREFFFVGDTVAADEMIRDSCRHLGTIKDIENPTVKRRFTRIVDALDQFRCEHCSNDPAATRRCTAEVEELFEQVKRYVLAQYRKAAPDFREPEVWLEFGYHHEHDVTDILDSTALSGASRIGDDAQTQISIVTLGVRDHGVDWRSVCQLPYLLMHELVCHAYQGAAAAGRTAVDASCAWSEGWMDALAAIEIERWLGGRLRKPDWVEINSTPIKRATAGFHERRYQRQTSLRPYILSQRVSARDGFSTLVEAFRGADTRHESALTRAARFSLRINLEPMPQNDRTKLVARLVADLESFFGPRRSDLLAACSRYAEDGDLANFQSVLDSLET